MTDMSTMTNAPREITIGEKKLKVRQLNLDEMFSYFEAKLRDKKFKEASEMAALLDAETKKEFLIDAWKKLPCGLELSQMVMDSLCSIENMSHIIYLACKDFHEEISFEDLRKIIGFNNLSELTPIIKWINGEKEDKDTTEKKTE